MENNIQRNMKEQQSYHKKKKCLEKGRQYYEENKESLQKTKTKRI